MTCTSRDIQGRKQEECSRDETLGVLDRRPSQASIQGKRRNGHAE